MTAALGTAPRDGRTELGLLVLVADRHRAAYMLASLGPHRVDPRQHRPVPRDRARRCSSPPTSPSRRLAPGADAIAAAARRAAQRHRLRVHRPPRRASLAGLQATWTVVGIAAFVAHAAVVRRARDLERYRYTFALVGIGLLLLPLVPGLGATINGARIWVQLGPINFQPGEFAKIALAIFFAAYLVERRELLAMATLPQSARSLPDPKHLGPRAVAWGFSIVVMVAEKDLGSSLLFFALFVVMLWVATERAVYLVIGARAVRRRRVRSRGSSFGHVQDRVDDLARTRGATRSARASRSCRPRSPSPGAARRHRARPRRPDAHPGGGDRLHLRRHRRGARPARRHRRS